MMVTLAFNELNKIHLVSNLGTMVVRINIQIKITRINFEPIFTPCSGVSIVDFEHVIACWEMRFISQKC